MVKNIIFGSTDDYCGIGLSGLKNNSHVLVLNDEKNPKSCMLRSIIDKCLQLEKRTPFLWILLYFFNQVYFMYITGNASISSIDQNVFIIFDVRKFAYNEGFLRFMQKRYNGKIAIVFYNPINKTSLNLERDKKAYDLLCVFDKDDSVRYSCSLIPSFYSKIDVLPDLADQSDIFFVGSSKGRLKALHSIFAKAMGKGIKCSFYITNVDEEDMLYPSLIRYNQRLSYSQVIQKVLSSKCILEVVQEDASGSTLRLLEAIIYSKKLISTNRNLPNDKYYDGRYMRILEDINTFDFSFVFDQEAIKYNYNEDEWMPSKMVEAINKEIL